MDAADAGKAGHDMSAARQRAASAASLPEARDRALAAGAAPGRPRSLWGDTWRQFRRHRLALGAAVVLLAVAVGTILGPEVIAYDPERIDFATKSQAPSLAHPFGTDELGRDQLVRVLDGGRISLAVALISVGAAMTVGVLVGAVAGYRGGFVDNALMRLVDVFYAMPGLFVVIFLVAVLGTGFWTIVLAIGALRWMGTARLVRAAFLSLKEREFVEAARASGATTGRIIARHLLPNALPAIVVAATLGIPRVILVEAALSFIGIGVQPPTPSWGAMILAGSNAARGGNPHLILGPAGALALTVLACNIVGDALLEAFDPWMRRAGRGGR